MSRKKRKRYRGQWCWCCDRIRANERFSGKGHARHLCRDCARLGAEELAFRQAIRNLGRCVDWSGVILRKQRKQFQRFLQHQNPRVRAMAQEMLAEDAQVRAERREWFQRESELEEALYDRELEALANRETAEEASVMEQRDQTGSDLAEIPF